MKCRFNQDIESSATNPWCILTLVLQTKGQKTSSICSDEIPSPCARCVSAGQITSCDSTSLSDTIFRVSGVGSRRFVLHGGTPQLVRTGSTGGGLSRWHEYIVALEWCCATPMPATQNIYLLCRCSKLDFQKHKRMQSQRMIISPRNMKFGWHKPFLGALPAQVLGAKEILCWVPANDVKNGSINISEKKVSSQVLWYHTQIGFKGKRLRPGKRQAWTPMTGCKGFKGFEGF